MIANLQNSIFCDKFNFADAIFEQKDSRNGEKDYAESGYYRKVVYFARFRI